MIDLTKYQDTNTNVIVTCNDGDTLVGMIISVDDEEESGLGEIGISLLTNDGRFLGIGQSEIQCIKITK